MVCIGWVPYLMLEYHLFLGKPLFEMDILVDDVLSVGRELVLDQNVKEHQHVKDLGQLQFGIVS